MQAGKFWLYQRDIKTFNIIGHLLWATIYMQKACLLFIAQSTMLKVKPTHM